jgi:hypothetical protein
MKIGTTEIYNQFSNSIYESRIAVTNDIDHYEKTREYFLSKLVPFKHYIHNFTNIDYDSLPNLTQHIPSKCVRSFANLAGLNLEVLKATISGIVEVNKALIKMRKELDIINKSEMDKDLFKEIIYRFNTKVSDEILKGYVFRPGFGIGNTRIKKVRTDNRKKKRVNWNESNKAKAKIIAEGNIPFKVTERDEDGKPTANNGGIKWLVYFDTLFDYLWHWGKKTATSLNVPYYKFRPTKYNNTSKDGKLGNINKLKQMVTNDSPLLNNFFIYEYI